MKDIIQSIIIPKYLGSKNSAIEWVKEHFIFKKIDIRPATYRFRQRDPLQLKRQYPNGHYIIKTLQNGVQLVIYLV